MDNEAMRDDHQPATRGDVRILREEIRRDFATKADLALGLDGLRHEMNRKFEAVITLITQTRSDIMAACERSLTRSEKVDHDQLFTRDRLDKIENRVTALEARRKRRPS